MLLENIKMALSSLKNHKLRSFLTMLGIIIGISSVISIVGLGEGGKDSILSQFEAIGSSTFTLTVNTKNANKNDYITSDDIEEIKTNIDSVKYISPVVEQYGMASANSKNKQSIVAGVNNDIFYINNLKIVNGRFMTEREVSTGKAVVVIDDITAKYFFGTLDCIGEEINISSTFGGKKATVVGVIESMMNTLGETGIEEVDEQIPAIMYSPYTFTKTIFNSNVSQVYIVPEEQDEIDSTAETVKRYITNRHKNADRDVYKISSLMSILDQIDAVMSILTSFIGAVAGISLLVGGIGIMNILLVSVTERTREIGIRKAIGATTKIILMQFLTEAIILSLLGGIIGLILGVIGAYALGAVAGVSPTISPVLVIGTLLFSSFVGLFFGIYPAKKAAKLNPIDALRYE